MCLVTNPKDRFSRDEAQIMPYKKDIISNNFTHNHVVLPNINIQHPDLPLCGKGTSNPRKSMFFFNESLPFIKFDLMVFFSF